jgi:hypothetical protein
MTEHCDRDCKELEDIGTRIGKAESEIVDIRICAGKKVTWGKLGTILALGITVFGAGALMTWARAKDVPEVKKVVQEHQDNITILKTNQQAILENSKEAKNDIKDVKDDVAEIKELMAELKALSKK